MNKHRKSSIARAMQITILFIILLSFLFDLVVTENSFGNNLIVNGDFSSPNIISPNLMGAIVQGWSCTHQCEILNCAYLQTLILGIGYMFSTCRAQVIDLNSNQHFQTVSQTFIAQVGLHRLSFNYYQPYYRANCKTLEVYLNKELIFRQKPQSAQLFKTFYIQKMVNIVQGQNVLEFTMNGLSQNDGIGFNIGNVSLNRRQNKDLEILLNNTLSNHILGFVNSIPGIRIYVAQLVNFFVSFDRLQFYYNHLHNYSRHFLILLENINELANLKGGLVQQVLQAISPDGTNEFNKAIASLNFKKELAFSQRSSKFDEDDGLIINNQNLIVYSMPYLLVVEIILYGLFIITKEYPISKIFRRYYFLGIVCLLFFVGNIEQFTFYLFGELLLFCSFSFLHKGINCALLIVYFGTLFTAAGSFLWFKGYYKKMLGFFLENQKSKLIGAFASTIDKGLICILFGVVHRLLLFKPITQFFLLWFIEIIWILSRSLFVGFKAYKFKILICFGIAESMLRMIFLLSTYIYNATRQAKIQVFLNEQVDFLLCVLFFIIWLSQFIAGILIFYLEERKLMMGACKITQSQEKIQGISKEVLNTIFEKKQTFRLNQINQFAGERNADYEQSKISKSKLSVCLD